MTLELALPETELFLPENMIGQGTVREAYRCGDFVLKVIKPRILKRVGRQRIEVDASQFLRMRYEIEDFNRYEFEQYQKLMQRIPAHLLDSFAKIIKVKEVRGRSVSINELVRDEDHSISRTLADNGPVYNTEFWERLSEIEQFFLAEKILHLGIDDKNVLVKTTEEGTLPVMIDYKRIGKQVSPRTLGMLFAYGRARKVQKEFHKLRKQYKSFI